MARLILEAVSRQSPLKDQLNVLVSVSMADSGRPVTGLTKANFKITNMAPSDVNDYDFSISECTLDPGDQVPTGVYDLQVYKKLDTGTHPPGDYDFWTFNAFGIQVQQEVHLKTPLSAITTANYGQTVVAVVIPQT